MEMLLGIDKIDITPDHPVSLAGYGHRPASFDGIHHPIYAKVLFIRQHDKDRGIRNRLLVAADLIWWGTELVERLRCELAARWEMGAEDVILNASHSHSGPQTSRLMPSIGKVDERYVHELETKLLDGIHRAESNLEPVTVQRGNGACDIGIQRRKLVEGRIAMSPNEEGPNDQEVTVVRFATHTGKAKALIVHYTCHPTTTSANFVSSEYCGIAMERIERELGDDCVSLFLQGCCGDVRPALHRDGRFYSGNAEDVQRLGTRLVESVTAVLTRPLQTLPSCPPFGLHITRPLPFADMPGLEELEACKRSDHSGTRNWAEQLQQCPELIRPAATLDMVRMDIAQGLSLLAMNAEMVVEYGLYVKMLSGGSTLPVAYSNGMIGYVPTAQQLKEGGYEATDSYIFFGLCSPFTETAEHDICNDFASLLNK
ncbi:neutral/alkaline non-lysosomal ceramidase N-terminal domain-containing protein [Paenibacillus oceani]|uniref:Neutral/alkaline non-lysosomal ceramidase N-terminal domain-containing protein n=1 Tax=Paenibacillus oceani TaxID=2772510 RepID=A0A927GYS4_9BACL|nr:neutral/alkaline non-lysosomal ceramidase N-terminal domain-containing protein [Paenibacillus oceani]MBD2860749.1 neutral/alkaline non-lysosomal ceramidase N-terminal domain-containing protein [Paenibacillus oceani]